MTPEGKLLTASFNGSSQQRGRQQGELFGERAKQTGILDFYVRYCERLLPKPNAVSRKLLKGLHALCARNQSEDTRRLVAGFCRASGMNARDVSHALVMPDAITFLAGLGARLEAVPLLGCTSLAAWGPYTKDGRFLYARNLDFVGNGFWDRFPVVSRHKPDRGLPYVSLGTAGLVVDGITGINEEGITVAVHQHLSRQISLFSHVRPILDLCHRILQFSRTLEQAVEEALSWPTTASWTLVLTHWKSRRACLVESSARSAKAFYFTEGKMARTNDYGDPALQSKEVNYPTWRQSSQLRALRADALLEKNRGAIDASVMAGFLRDRVDADRDTTRGFAQTIANPCTMTSVVIAPEEGALWLAEGPAPVCDGDYRRVALWEDSSPGASLSGVPESLSPQQSKSCRHYVDALMAHQEERSDADVAKLLALAVENDEKDPVYRYMHGLFAFRAGNPEQALESFASGAALPDIAHRSSAQCLWRARTLDVLGRRKEALALYADLSEGPVNPALKKAAHKGLSRAYRESSLASSIPDFSFGDVYAY